jgi:hypothetical protein
MPKVLRPESHVDQAFQDQLLTAVQTFRAGLIDLLASVNANADRPQELARRFSLDKNLAWKISRIVGSSDPLATVPLIPGTAGARIFLKAFELAGADPALIENVRRALRAINQVIRVHASDRATFEIMASNMLPSDLRNDHVVQNRKLAFRGNSATWGVQATTQSQLAILAPNEHESDMADFVQVSSLTGFRRLRGDARWLLFRRERWSDHDPLPARDEAVSLDPDFPVERGVALIGEFCSKPIPQIEVIQIDGEDQYELPPGPVGDAAAITCVFGELSRRVGSTRADAAGEYVEIGLNLITPVQNMLFDLLVHRDFGWALDPEFILYSRLDGGGMQMTTRRHRNRLPASERVHDLGGGVGGLATTLVPRYSALVEYTLGRLNWQGSDFRAFRVSMAYPPIPTVALLRAALPLRNSP